MRPSLLFSAVTLLLASFATAQSASITFAGTGCQLERQTLAIKARGLPQLGAAFALEYVGPNHEVNSTQSSVQPILNLGFAPLGLPIPPILPGQPIGCVVYVAPAVSIAMVGSGRGTYASGYKIGVPNNRALLGAVVFAQWLGVKMQCGFAGCGLNAVATSDYATITIGT